MHTNQKGIQKAFQHHFLKVYQLGSSSNGDITAYLQHLSPKSDDAIKGELQKH